MWCVIVGVVFFFFKQKTAYELRISDWSSDVCSSDLIDLDQAFARETREQSANGLKGKAQEIADFFAAHAQHELGRRITQRGIALRQVQIGRASCRERVCQYV